MMKREGKKSLAIVCSLLMICTMSATALASESMFIGSLGEASGGSYEMNTVVIETPAETTPAPEEVAQGGENTAAEAQPTDAGNEADTPATDVNNATDTSNAADANAAATTSDATGAGNASASGESTNASETSSASSAAEAEKPVEE